MGAEGARRSMGTKSAQFASSALLVHLKGLVEWFSPCGHEGRGRIPEGKNG